MSGKVEEIKAVPTNIISGFLGVGKTSAILKMLNSKPATERWAVLVNEFGEIGVDGSLFSGQHSQEQGVFIREVPGGCMCCAAGLPMQIALNQLLVRSKPDRLLIEPTGLGHPVEVLEVLTSDIYKQIICLQKTLTLVDARKLRDSKYTQHQTFNQQIAIADIVIGNKQDLYQSGDKDALVSYVEQVNRSDVPVAFAEYGEIDIGMLAGNSMFEEKASHGHQHSMQRERVLASEKELPEEGFIKAANQGEGYQSVGWRFSANKVFDRNKLLVLLNGLSVERMKGVFITQEGVFGYNLTADALTEFELDECAESRIEVISQVLDESFELQLTGCILG